jgi:hypothetical protein
MVVGKTTLLVFGVFVSKLPTKTSLHHTLALNARVI